MYIAHRREDGKQQSLKEHLTEVSTLAGQYAEVFGAREHAERTGLLHDIGKYGAPQQRRMNDPENVPKVDHSTAGVQMEYCILHDPYAAFAIAGHHGGLPDKGTSLAKPAGTLMARLDKNVDDYSAYHQDGVAPKTAVETPAWVTTARKKRDTYTLSVYIRMLFSCLVDADFLNTEAFMLDEAPPRGVGDAPKILRNRLTAWLNQRGFLTPQNELNARRSAILRQCMDGESKEQGLYTLTVPTGGGKTIASLAFALSHADNYGLRRVIYVVPYTNIIEQTAQTFREILGEENVLEHHANVDFNDDASDAEQRSERRRLAAENWDAPIVVTTAVQFFESFYGAKPSKCRKLHNIAGSVLIFDEAQMMPSEHLTPCVAAIAELVKHYRVTAVLCTATQPALDGLFRERGVAASELIEGADELYQWFRRVRYASRQMADLLEPIHSATDLETLRGLEGKASAAYFSVADELILGQKESFHFDERSRRPPRDPLNAMLSFAYTLLANDCASALASVGLDAYVGFLHRDRPGRRSLALDLMEELRCVYADRLVLTLINNRVIRKEHFRRQEGGAVLLNDEGRKALLNAWQTRKRDAITHPYLGEKIPWGLVPYVQALLLARYLRGDLDGYPPFLWK